MRHGHVSEVRTGRLATGERGVVIVIVALSVTALLVIVALVIDYGAVRQNRQADKSASDFAAAAGIRALDDGSGLIYPWKGICAAREYLKVNGTELGGLSDVSFTDGTGTVSHPSDPCDAPSLAPYTTPCGSSSLTKSTWGIYSGTIDGGRIRVTIKSGYEVPDPAFPEDDNAYDGDDGAAASHGCDHLAVIVEESEGAYFGGVAGASSYETRVRSLSRLVEGTDGDVTAALVLLERDDCQALNISGIGASVRILGNGPSPGVIHSDSLGRSGSCGRIFAVNGSTPPPRVIAEDADLIDPVTNAIASGQISTVALSGALGAAPDNVSDGLDHVCARQTGADCGSTAPVSGVEPSARDLLGRDRVDSRYLGAVTALRSQATTRFAWSATSPPDMSWHQAGCPNGNVTYNQTKIWFDCDGGEFRAGGKIFESTVQEVVINGSVKFAGPGTFHFKGSNSVGVTRLFIKGQSGDAIALSNNNAFYVNDGGLSDLDADGFVCDDRHGLGFPPGVAGARTEMVIGTGGIKTNGGDLRLCQTALFMMDGSGSGGACPLPNPASYIELAPYNNGCAGKLRAAGGSGVDWSAPNAKYTSADEANQTDWNNFEDLAFWSESSGHSGDGWAIIGTGDVYLAGIFFTPNANAFKVGGEGLWNISDAQFITRKLEVVGGGELTMQPDSFNSIQIPALKGFTLVR